MFLVKPVTSTHQQHMFCEKLRKYLSGYQSSIVLFFFKNKLTNCIYTHHFYCFPVEDCWAEVGDFEAKLRREGEM